LLYWKILCWMAVGVSLIILAVLEWLKWLFETPPHPVMATVIALLGCAIIAWYLKNPISIAKQMALGLKGERVVGQCLDELRESGYKVFHDIIGNGHNIDHAIVGPAGVFAIETKTVSKPIRGNPTVIFDGESIRVNGLAPDRDPVIQAKAGAAELARLIRNNYGPAIKVKPIIIYPGWFVEEAPNTDVLVRNPERLLGYIKQTPAQLSDADIKQISMVIAMYSRHVSTAQ